MLVLTDNIQLSWGIVPRNVKQTPVYMVKTTLLFAGIPSSGAAPPPIPSLHVDPRFVCEHFDTVKEIKARLAHHHSRTILISMFSLQDGDVLDIADYMKKKGFIIPFIVTSHKASHVDITKVFKHGAVEYIETATLDKTLIHAIQYIEESYMFGEDWILPIPERLSNKFQEIHDKAMRLARYSDNVMIFGEDGTGKEYVAREIHFHSSRRKGTFYRVDCEALPHLVYEKEIDGNRPAISRTPVTIWHDIFRKVGNGILFLDGIEKIPTDFQASLMHAIHNPEDCPEDVIGIVRNLCVLSASNICLKKLQTSKGFRSDLFCKLAEFNIKVPSLRECKADIIVLANHFLNVYSKRFEKSIHGFTKSAEQLLLDYLWPHNISELRNVCRNAVMLCADSFIGQLDLDIEMADPEELGYALHTREEEINKIVRALEQADWVQEKAAALLKISSKTLSKKMKKYHISRPKERVAVDDEDAA